MRNVLLALIFCIALVANASATQADMFTVSSVNKVLNIKTNSPNTHYDSAGISLVTPGYSILSGCQWNLDTKYCIFGVSDTVPANIALSGNTGLVEFKLCLNGNVPSSCQHYTREVKGKFLYVPNLSNSGADGVDVCTVKTNGELENCVAAGNTVNNFDGPASLSINPITNIAYVINYPGTSISVCPIKSDGKFANCTQNVSFDFSYGGSAINPAGTLLYVTNYNTKTVDVCDINRDGTLGACTDTGAGTGGTESPLDLILNKEGTKAYVVRIGTSFTEVSFCLVSGKTFTCSDANGTFLSPAGIAFSKDESQVYVTNYLNDSVTLCDVATNGTLSCIDSGYSTGTSAWGITIDGASARAYISNYSENTVTKCSISAEASTKGKLTGCAVTGPSATFNTPVIMTLSK